MQICGIFLVIITYQGIKSQFSPPIFQNLPEDGLTFELGKEVLLPCSATGNPNPKVVNWLIDDKLVNLDTNILTSNGDLKISRVQKSDAGRYQCVASNNLGGLVSQKRQIYIAYFERIVSVVERVTKQINDNFYAAVPDVDTQPKPKYIWSKNGVLLAETSRIRINNNGELFISNLDLSDDATYTLYIENTFLQNKNVPYANQLVKTVVLRIFGSSSTQNTADIIYVSQKQDAVEGETAFVTLECFITGQLMDQVQLIWSKINEDGTSKQVPNSSKYILKDNGRRLNIVSPTYKDDNGKFICSILNNLNVLNEKEVLLNVYSTPEILVKPIDIYGYTDNTSSLNCVAQGFPSVNVTWYRNGIPVSIIGKHTVLPNNTLLLNKLNWEDNGLFQCAASNIKSIVFAQAQVKVLNISASILGESTDIYAGFNSNIEIPCVAVGAPMPIIYWLINNSRISFPNSDYTLLQNGSLIIKKFDGSGSVYTCVADNMVGISRKYSRVFVIVPTKISEYPQRETYARKGENVRLACTVISDPNINFTREWRYNNLIVQDPRYIVQPDGSLIVKFVQEIDTGIDFSCHVFSLGGNPFVSTSLVLVQLPMIPSTPRVIDTQPFSLQLTWDAPSDGGSPLTGYQLYMENFTMNNFLLLAQLQPEMTSFTVNNLLAGAKYRFRIAALNKFGKGFDSDPTSWIETQALAPTAAPDGFRTSSIGMDSITLVWMIPPQSTHNGELLGFYIGYRLAGYGMDFTNIDVKGITPMYTMTGLPLFTRYELKVAAYNKAGIGPWSSTINVDTKQGIPSAPPTNVSVSVLTATTVSVSFTSPPQQQWNGQLTKIIARTWPPGRPQDQQEYSTDYNPSSLYHQTFVLPNLKPNTEYTLAVAVATSGGPSPGSSAVQFKTSEGVPDAVRDLMVSGIYSDAFTVSWKLPKESAGELKGYRIKYRVFNNINEWSEFVEVPIALGAVIRPLLPRTRYEVSVAAFTSKGTGSFVSASVETIESPVLPSAPSNLKSYGIWGSNISLGWTPGDSGRAVFLYYLIEYNNDTAYHISQNPPVWRLIRNLTKILENPANIPGLKHSTTYRFRMQGFNIVGPSPYSNVSADITTSEGVPSKAPLRVWASAPERQALLIEWNPPEAESWNSGSIKYQFIIKPKDIDPEIQFAAVDYYDTQAKSYLARGLQKYLMYNITMRLFNDKGFGPWSTPVFFRTSEDYPAGAPINIVAKALDSSTIQLTWEPVPIFQRNGQIIGYKAFYSIKNLPDTELFKDFPGNLTLRGTINKLVGFVDYEIYLMAYTRVGGNFRGNPVTVRTLEGVPGKPHDVRFPVVTYSYAQLTWEEPLRPNGVIIAYEVRYCQTADENKWITYQRDKELPPRTAQISGLVYNSYYIFEIKARTAVGWGEPAIEKVLITSERFAPDSPVILPIPHTNVRAESIVVSWLPRFDGNSPIRGYNLQYIKDYGVWKTFQFGIPPTINLPASMQEAEVTKLFPASTYQFRVKAINDIGDSPWSDVTKRQITQSPDTLGGPTKVYVTGKTSTSLEFAWEPPISSTSLQELRGYRVGFKEVGGVDDEKEMSVSSSQLSFKLTNLKVFQAYDVRIGAFTDQNIGVWTPVYQWRTGEAAPTEAPRNVKVNFQGASIVRVTWESPAADSIRGYLQGFKVESTRIGLNRRRRSIVQRSKRFLVAVKSKRSLDAVCQEFPAVQTHLAGPFSYEVTIKNLRKYTSYAITVRVYNSFSDGPKSSSIQFTTPSDIPGPPYLLSQRIYTSLIDVDFAAPCEPNGQVLGYRVQYKEKNGGFFTTVGYNKHTRRIRISNLRPLTSYLLSLSARTEVGYGLNATIEFNTKEILNPPQAPGPPDAPEVYKNQPGVLIIQWQEGDTRNIPADLFNLQYSLENGLWTDFKTVTPDQLRYDGTAVVYTIIGLKQERTYRFRVRSTTVLGTSPYSNPSKPITPVKSSGLEKPFYREIWFIFVVAISLLLVILLITICCCYHFKNKKKYITTKPGQKISSFEMSLLQNDESNERLLRSPSTLAPSSKKGDTLRSSTNSIAKSVRKSHDSDSDSQQQSTDPTSIANHYSNDPNHKNWSDSMDKKTKKEILSEFNKRSDGNLSKGKNRRGSEEVLNRPRARPGRPDLTEQKKLARSEPMLAEESPIYQQPDMPKVRRPAKTPFDPALSRSQPDIQKQPKIPENPITRQSSFLRATLGGSDDKESFQDAFEREKSKRELAMELDSRLDSSYPSNAPPPYDFNSAPPAYTPSQADEDELASEMGYPVKPPILPKPYRWSDRSTNSNNTPSSHVYTPPYTNRNYVDNSQPNLKYPQVNNDRGYPLNSRRIDDRFSPEPRFSPSRSLSSGDSIAHNIKFNDELKEDEIDGFKTDTTLV
ncbi:protein sidekick-1 isoform X1 [Hydra vulgaris]|uniref:protein sidekick-1 isoform X1 n=1 Tax=Hydra vulgaris TaxID=6087 RepID=UPI001F5E5C19|nr:protein sidekick-1 isoform X1 [Hydra vulgaris]XP_047144343.1 protein sidekick-1 isoform X1 [Hydra vulgaris]